MFTDRFFSAQIRKIRVYPRLNPFDFSIKNTFSKLCVLGVFVVILTE